MINKLIKSKNGYNIPCQYNIKSDDKIVCIIAHGFGSNKNSPTAIMLDEQLPKYGIGTFAFDFPAHGDSPVDGLKLTVDACIEDLAASEAYVRELAPNAEIVYFGSSFGAYTMLNYLATRPHTGHKAFFRSAAVCMPELFHHKTTEQEAELTSKGYLLFGATYEYERPIKLTRDFFDSLDAHDVFSLWHNDAANIYMIHGESDQIIPLSEAKRFAEKFGIPMTIVQEGDHRLSILGAPEKVLQMAINFFVHN